MWYRFAKTVYHCTKTKPGLGQKSGYFSGIYTSLSLDHAKHWGDNVYATDIDLDKIYNANDDNLKEKAQKNGFGYHSGNGNSEVAYLKSLGFYGIQQGLEVCLFDNAPMEFVKLDRDTEHVV